MTQVSQAAYAEMVRNLTKKGEDIVRTFSSKEAEMIHAAIGIAGEAGEVLDAIKKAVIYQRLLNRDNLIEELGDIEFYMEGMRQLLNVTRDEVLQANMDKLAIRYRSGGYTDAQAQERADKQ